MLSGECQGTEEDVYFARSNTTTPADTLVDILTMTATGLGLALNILSLVIFLRIFKKANSRNSFHLFLVFLSACEITFCLTSGLTYGNVISSKKGRFVWTGFEDEDFGVNGSATTKYEFRIAMYLPTESAVIATIYYNLVVLFAYLAVASQFARNSWVAITALLRCYVATRRTNVQVSKIYSIGRISMVFVGQLFVVVALSLIRTYVNHTTNFFNFNFHTCNTSSWHRGGTVLLHVTGNQEKQRRVVNMAWTLLSQVIPLVAIITSSILLVNSLRANSMVDSSERNKKITRMVFIFSLAFTLLEIPRAAVFFLANFLLKDRLSHSVILRIYQTTYILSLADSTVNVFIYFFNDAHFKKELCHSRCCAGGDNKGGCYAVARGRKGTKPKEAAEVVDEEEEEPPATKSMLQAAPASEDDEAPPPPQIETRV